MLGKNKKQFPDVEKVKECLVEITQALFEGKERQEMSEKLKKIPLSNDTSTRRTEVLAHDLVKQLTDDIKDAPCFSLAVDESTNMQRIKPSYVCLSDTSARQRGHSVKTHWTVLQSVTLEERTYMKLS